MVKKNITVAEARKNGLNQDDSADVRWERLNTE